MSNLEGFKRSAWSHGSSLFSLGVASGDPTAQGFTIWTRLAPAPLIANGGMPPQDVPVRYEIATDPLMRKIVQRGTAIASHRSAHNLKVHIRGLRPHRHYWYRFSVRAEGSIVGRTKTLPDPRASLSELRLATVSCQDYQNGYFTAYEHLAHEDLDAVLHLGDYIYEYEASSSGPRAHVGQQTQTLEDYRVRYAQYRLDPCLQAAHAAFPFICTWDDHEVQDNYADLTAKDPQAQATFRSRRQAAYRAFLEHMPLGPEIQLGARSTPIYRSFSFGQLLDLHVLDTRQYRDEQPCREREISEETDVSFACDQLSASDRTMLGVDQERWLSNALERSQSRWNVLAQQVMLTPWNLQSLYPEIGPELYNMDAWDGYPRARDRLLRLLEQHQVQNPIILSGDIHTTWAAEIKRDPDKEPVAAEFVTTSITSEFPEAFVQLVYTTLPNNPHLRFFEGRKRGYSILRVRPDDWQTDFRGVSSIQSPHATISTYQSMVVEAGSSKISIA